MAVVIGVANVANHDAVAGLPFPDSSWRKTIYGVCLGVRFEKVAQFHFPRRDCSAPGRVEWTAGNERLQRLEEGDTLLAVG